MDDIRIMFAVAAVIGIGFAIVYNKLVEKSYPEKDRNSKNTGTIIGFLLIALAVCGLLVVKNSINAQITKKSTEIEQYIKNAHPNNALVKNGLDMTKVNNDVSRLNDTVNGIRELLPTAGELGINKTLYNMVVDSIMDELKKHLSIIDFSVKTANSFADENDILTVSSLIGSLRANAINLVNNVFLVIIAIITLLFLICVIPPLVKAAKMKQTETKPEIPTVT